MNLIERLKRTEYDDLDACKAAEALELAYEMLDHLCLGAVECNEEIERLTGASKSYEAQANKDCLEIKRLTAERDALKAALQLIKANTNTLDWPDDINAAIQGAGE